MDKFEIVPVVELRVVTVPWLKIAEPEDILAVLDVRVWIVPLVMLAAVEVVVPAVRVGMVPIVMLAVLEVRFGIVPVVIDALVETRRVPVDVP